MSRIDIDLKDIPEVSEFERRRQDQLDREHATAYFDGCQEQLDQTRKALWLYIVNFSQNIQAIYSNEPYMKAEDLCSEVDEAYQGLGEALDAYKKLVRERGDVS